jgi:hypothetical protein
LKGSELLVLEVGSVLCETREKTSASPVSSLQVGDTSGGGYGSLTLEHLGESSLCDPATGDDSEASPMMGVVETEEVKDFTFMQEMSLVLEVSSIAGLSCDGQAGLF